MLGQSNFAFAVPLCRHKHLHSLGYTLTPPTSVLRECFPLSLGEFEVHQVVNQATPPRLLWAPPPMPISTIDETTLQQGFREAVMATVAAYDNGWSERWLFRKPTHRRRSRWCWVRRRPYSRVSGVQVLHPYSRASRTSAWSIRTFNSQKDHHNSQTAEHYTIATSSVQS